MVTLSSLQTAGIKECVSAFSSLDALNDHCEGDFEASILGPKWLKCLANLSLPLVGLKDWYGKRILSDGAINLCREGQAIVETIPMTHSYQASWVDGRDCLVLSYPRSAPLLLRPMRDEFRRLDTSTLLGLSFYDRPGFKSMPLPFLLSTTNAAPQK